MVPSFSKAESLIYVTSAIIVHENFQKKQCAHTLLSSNESPGAPHPRFPVEFCGFPELHAPLLKERRTRGPVPSCVQEIRGIPRFPVGFCGFPELHAPLLKERRTRGPVPSCVQEIRGIPLFFCERWDTVDLPLKPIAGPIRPGYRALRTQRLASPNKIGERHSFASSRARGFLLP
jgi:hypothetical protein